ncbi:LacI family transcriptional regulator [Egibacter rhizosphaerae]|uniref:LacI family transcriptional regulator n=1 Tax=Egibacter rhizosphaerae TaxID=1670831 RepID=A0A411YI07_9ACTN|nr:LacI family DNA-binding transcriptional regulator [Egibacter rhizosphaerae]QBI20898.1 LacI family transcriptional regulator [Egibacter rhizosphaerae]
MDGSEATHRDNVPVTLHDVAREAQVHVSTVSRALDPSKSSLVSDRTRERVAAAAESLGYRRHLVASGLRRGRTFTVGVVVPDIANPIYAPVVRGIAHTLDDEGYMPVVADTEDDDERFAQVINHLLSRRIDALITTAARERDEPRLRSLWASGTPVILAVRTLSGSGLPSVDSNDEAGAAMAARHLWDRGHRVVAQLRGPHDVEPFSARGRGFVEEAERLGFELRTIDEEAARPTIEDGEHVADRLLTAHPDVTAVFAQNDLLALGLLMSLRRLGRNCPDDLAIVGYNDAMFAAHSDPPLTTVRLPTYEVGRHAGATAVACIDRPHTPPPRRSVTPELIVRASTG